MSQPSKKLAYTIEEAAALLSLSRAHVYRLLDIGRLRSITIGRSRRITQRQLEEFIAACEEASVWRSPLQPGL